MSGRCAESRGRLGNYDVCGDDEGSDGGRVLERAPRDHSRVRDAGRNHVLVLAGEGVEAHVVVPVSDLRHDGPVGPGVDRDLLYRFLQRPVDDQGARPLVAVQGVEQFSHRSLGVQQGHAAAWHDTLFEGRAGRRERVLHAVLLP